MVAKSLAEGLISSMAGVAFDEWLGETRSEDVVGAIRQSIQDLERRLKADNRRALNEDRIKELEGLVSAIQIGLTRYSGLYPADKPRYIYLLTQCEVDTSHGIGLAKQYGMPALPAFTIFVSLRTYMIAAFAALDHLKGPVRNYGRELVTHAEHVRTTVIGYDAALDPEVRLGQMECRDRGVGGRGFKAGTYSCRFSEDGEFTPENRAYLMNGDEPKIRKIAARQRLARVASLSRVRFEQRQQVIAPMYRIEARWLRYAAKLIRS